MRMKLLEAKFIIFYWMQVWRSIFVGSLMGRAAVINAVSFVPGKASETWVAAHAPADRDSQHSQWHSVSVQ